MNGFEIGDRVNHKKYGDGTVKAYYPNRDNEFLVEFDNKHDELHDGYLSGIRYKDHRCYWFGFNAEPTNTLRKIDKVREVKREAKVGEWIKVVDAQGTMGNYKNGDVLQIINARTFGNSLTYYKDEAGCWLWHDEYVVLEGYKPPKKETVTLYGFDDAGRPVSEDVEVPGVSKTKFKSIGKTPTVCDKCGQSLPDKTDWQCGDCGHWNSYKVGRCVACHDEKNHKPKRVYTEAQIQEARDIVYRLMINRARSAIQVDSTWARNNDNAITATLLHYSMGNWHKEKSATAHCSPDDEYNDHIGIMVAVCKLTETEMPKWVCGDKEK